MARRYRQAAVIPFRVRRGVVEIALVTTPGGKYWVVPKGSLDDGEAPRDAAIRETEEEAGLLGVVSRRPLGRYEFTRDDQHYDVDVYVMRVTVVLDYWPEARLRRRRWVGVEEAVALVREDLQPFVRGVGRLARSNGHAPRRAPRLRAVGVAR
jgi:phosphohistidine phosphatase